MNPKICKIFETCENLDYTLLTTALDLAETGHAGAFRRNSNTPYVEHPKQVAKLLRLWGVEDSEVLAAAFAHDLLEDSKELTEAHIEERLGKNVLSMVKALSHNKDTETKVEYISRLSLHDDLMPVLIKAADRFCNTIDFIISREKDPVSYFHAADAIFKRLGDDQEKLGEIYTRYYADKQAIIAVMRKFKHVDKCPDLIQKSKDQLNKIKNYKRLCFSKK